MTWNGIHHLKRFLPSVVATNYDNFEIIISDNNSTDGSKEWIQQHYPNIKLVALEENFGYCGGNNRAVSFADNEILIFLNNDVSVDAEWLTGLSKSFYDVETAAAQPKLLSYKQPGYFEYAGAAGGCIDKFGYPFCRGRVLETVEEDLGQFEEPSEIFWASGAALAIRKEVFLEVGGFDENFEFHMEEIDLCWRVHRMNKKVVYAPKSMVYHLGGGSLAMGSPRKVYYNFRNNLFMLWKNYTTMQLFTLFPIRLILDVIAAYKSLFSGNFSDFKAIAKAHLHFFKDWGKVHRSRKAIPFPKKSSYPGMYSISMIWRYFIRNKKTYAEITK